MAVHINGQSFDLPPCLGDCRRCKRGQLIWSPQRRAWVCTNGSWATVIDADFRTERTVWKPKCRNGTALAAFFDVDDVHAVFSGRGPLNIAALPCTSYICGMVARGELALSWTPKRRPSEKESSEDYDRMMRDAMGRERRRG